MTYRVKDGRPIEVKAPEALDAVRWTLHERGDAFALAMAFDPGDAPGTALSVHAAELLLGLLHLRGWRRDPQEVRVGRADTWPDPWWDHPLGPNAFVLESDLVLAAGNDPDDLARIASLAIVAWSMEREMRLRGRPIPDLMTAFAPEGLVLASLHPEPLRAAMRAQRQSILERMAALPEPMRRPTHAHVLIHLAGSTVRPWSLPDRACAFGTPTGDPAIDRVYVALEDTAEAPRPETARTLLHMMLASGTDD